MTPIEAAADDIARIFSSRWRFEHDKECIAAIITRHLFPVVRPEDVKDGEWYHGKIGNVWAFVGGDFARKSKSVTEIRGPVVGPDMKPTPTATPEVTT